jgi:broad specificity phosphatase PhoE
MKIFIIRHGESTSDAENRYGGDYDDHLTERGVAQATALAAKLADRGIRTIFSSPRIRAKETAVILRHVLHGDMQIADDLRERNTYGLLTGMEKNEARRKYPDLVDLVRDREKTIEGAESHDHFRRRVEKIFLGPVCGAPYDTIAVISHGGPIKCIFRDVLGLGELNDLADCAVIELEKNGADFAVVAMDGASFA